MSEGDTGVRYRIVGYFRGVKFREQTIQFLFAKSNFTNGDTEPCLLHINYFFHDFNFRRLAVLSRNSRNINASKITRYTVIHECLRNVE